MTSTGLTLTSIHKIMLLQGGISHEKDISLLSGKACLQALLDLGNEHHFDVIPYNMTHDFEHLITTLKQEKPDIVFNCLHGAYGEDGFIQALLDSLKIPYTHSGRYASSALMDKPTALHICRAHNIPAAQSWVATKQDLETLKPPFPFVIKHCQGGSSIDVHIFKNSQDFNPKTFTWPYKEALVEEYIKGKELTVAVLNGKPLTVTELITAPDEDFYDFDAKYKNGKTKHQCPAHIPQDIYHACMTYAEKCYHIFRCRGLMRVDFRYNEEENRLCFLEGNTIPGMTPYSLAPEQAAHCQIDFKALIRTMLEHADHD